MEKPRYFCQECNKELKPGQKVCPVCKSSKRLIKVGIKSEFKPRSGLRGKQKRKGVGGYIRECFTGWQNSRNKKKHPKGVIRKWLVDRIDYIYKEKVKDVETGEITRDVEEDLREHRKKNR